MGYTHIDDSERRRVEKAIISGKGVRAIARMTGRSPSTISDELQRNSVRKKYEEVRTTTGTGESVSPTQELQDPMFEGRDGS